jgi:hypothetical protein
MHLERFAADMLHECPVLCQKLGLEGLARLATCSQAHNKSVETVVSMDGLGFLDRAFDRVNRARERLLLQQLMQAVAWLAAYYFAKRLP